MFLTFGEGKEGPWQVRCWEEELFWSSPLAANHVASLWMDGAANQTENAKIPGGYRCLSRVVLFVFVKSFFTRLAKPRSFVSLPLCRNKDIRPWVLRCFDWRTVNLHSLSPGGTHSLWVMPSCWFHPGVSDEGSDWRPQWDLPVWFIWTRHDTPVQFPSKSPQSKPC